MYQSDNIEAQTDQTNVIYFPNFAGLQLTKNKQQKYPDCNGMLRHSLATLEGELDFVAYCRDQ